MILKDAAAAPVLETPPRFSISSEPLKGVTIGQFREAMDRAAQQSGVPPALANTLRAAGWVVEAVGFRAFENKFFEEGAHRPYLAELVARGEAIAFEISRTGFAEGAALFGVEDFRSVLRSLHLTFLCEYGPNNSQQTDEQIVKLFDV